MAIPESLFRQLDAPPIFVVGAARSGTTWVYDILTAHPLVAGAYETWLFTPVNGFGSLFTKAHWPPKHSGLGKLLSREEVVAVVREAAERILSRAIVEGRRFLVEKSPNHLYAIPLLDEIFPGCRVVHVLRDGRDVSVSVRAAAKSWVPDWRESFGRSVAASGKAWNHAVEMARRLGEPLGERFLEIRYEALRQDPTAAIGKLFAFCGIPCDAATIADIREKTDFERNYKPDPQGFRRKGVVGDWRGQLGLSSALAFHRVAGKALFRLGYETDRRWWLRRRRKTIGEEA